MCMNVVHYMMKTFQNVMAKGALGLGKLPNQWHFKFVTVCAGEL